MTLVDPKPAVREKTIKIFGVILSGAGYLDGSEIQEAVLVLLALDRAGAKMRVFAPDVTLDEIDHLTQKATGASRRALVEAARIARSNVKDLGGVHGADCDAWILPGGYGAAKNLSDFATKGAQGTVNKDVARVLREAFAAQMPVGACCIAPAVVGLVLKQLGQRVRLTIGNDPETAKQLAAMGHTHVECAVDDICVDAERRVVTAPAYMYDAPIGAVATGIEKMVKQVIAWA
jgi:enhancing lycopene biosynthesis protein 2